MEVPLHVRLLRTVHMFEVRLKTHFYSLTFNKAGDLRYLDCCIITCCICRYEFVYVSYFTV